MLDYPCNTNVIPILNFIYKSANASFIVVLTTKYAALR